LQECFPYFSFWYFLPVFGGGANPFAKDDGEVEENIENLMGIGSGNDERSRYLSLPVSLT
jgi:hypothetical protein